MSERSALSRIVDFYTLGDGLATAGQPTAEQFQDIKAAGFEVVINLALPTSDHALENEAAIVTGLGMIYLQIPVVFEAPTDADFLAFCDAMRAFRGRRIFVHCVANMRVSAFLFLHRVLHEGVTAEAANYDLHAIWWPNKVWSAFMQRHLTQVQSTRQ